ncbi:SDR family NAD(P)-dependent oxidoreductase [Aphanizomenon sp. PH219]|uniref:SDR family NAD(P)-dependent oxidoreductase n=2 Tax=Dolichospermum TaxID=748770 RepID=A0ABY5M2K9_9CYAN|nr:non-ribosomal peptide synthetase [Dolichospermum heterosporum]MDK2411425.1 SDR family NAD(P)-dependent oxidoreductase [Aphanizomenon sp. 202]MDK2459367.1 SDR family NAD(P)-dependent oxidoreductase [Aphanizomenon sp. PH219]UUO17100.1 SDR family NAD(P)-dependent oxidoreductase [Dolichospermum heterosporum TAC447]
MNLDNHNQILATSTNENFTYQKIEVAIRSSLTVDDCVVIKRQTEKVKQELIAYIVPSGLFAPEQLLSHLQTILPSELTPTAFVPVSTIPLTETGQVDEVALASLEVIKSDLIRDLEKQLESLSEIDQVAVVVEPVVKSISIPPVHLEDLLGETPANPYENNQQEIQVSTHSQNIENKNYYLSKKLAISHSEPLPYSPDAPKNLVEVLQRASENSNKGIIYIKSDGSETFQSYRKLWQDAQIILAGLRKTGLKPQDKVIFQLEDNQDFICAFWGCVLGGFVPVPVSIAPIYEPANNTASKLKNTWEMLEKPLVLTSGSLAADIDDFARGLNLENFKIVTVDELRQCEADLNIYENQPEDLAILLLTSGSTGIPKCVMLNHRNILSMTTGLILMGHFSSQESVLNWMPLDHVGALVSLSIMAASLGCQQIHVHTDLIVQKPLHWLDLIDKHQATISWSPNFAFSLICDRAVEINRQQWDLSSMKFIINAGEPIVTKTARNFLKLLSHHGLPTNAIHPAFGMCETSSGITYSDSFSLESSSDQTSFVELGLPIAGAALRIVDENEQIVTENTIGRLQVKGASVTIGYYQNPQANQEAFTTDGWFNTGDLGFLDQGRLTITGRIKDVIIINGLNYYCHEIEAAVEEMTGVEVSYTGACAVRQPGSNTDKLAIFFNTYLNDDQSLLTLLKEIRACVVNKVRINPDYLIPIDKDIIPKTAIGKIQRSQLSQRFQTGEFKSTIKRVDILLGNSNTIPNWFYRQVWKPKSPITVNSSLTITNTTLVFLDDWGLGDYLCQTLSENKLSYITVYPGKEFQKISSSHYVVNPEIAKDYQLLIESLAADKIIIGQILHLWTYDKYQEINNIDSLEKAQAQGIYSLLFLVQALAKVQGTNNYIQLLFISSHIQSIASDDPIAYEKSTVLGLLKTIPQELPKLNCRHIDLPFAEVEKNGFYILQEMQISSKERELAYRNGQRLISRLEQVDFTNTPKSSITFQQEGTYLITGGLGGIGVEVARYLLKHYQAKLLLVGRTPLNSEKHIKLYQELAQLGGEVIYESVDICDLEQLQIIVEKAQFRWGENLDGILHLAGTFHEQQVLEETQENLAAILCPKLLGAWVLHQLAKENQASIFINFSSAHGFFGSTAVGGYAAANSFLDSFTHYQNSPNKLTNKLTSYCFSWSMWDDTGMSQGYQMKNLIRAKGSYIMSCSQAISSMLASLHHQQHNLLIGLDGSNQNILRWQSSTFNLQKLTAYFTTNTGEVVKLPGLKVQDNFGNVCIYDSVQLPEMPCLENGEVDRARLIKRSNNQENREQIEPRNEIELKIAQCWQQVLKVTLLGIHDNFFELGGNSLLAGQVISRLREDFSLELSLQRLLQTPTIVGLAQTIAAIQTVTQSQNTFTETSLQEYEEDYL